MAQYRIGGQIVVAVLDVVDIAGNIHDARAGFNAGAGNGAVEAVRAVGIRSACVGVQIMGKVQQGVEQGPGAGFAHAAQ